jgi:hypothetical protein
LALNPARATKRKEKPRVCSRTLGRFTCRSQQVHLEFRLIWYRRF